MIDRPWGRPYRKLAAFLAQLAPWARGPQNVNDCSLERCPVPPVRPLTGSERKIATARDEVDVRGVANPFCHSQESAWGFARDALPFEIDPNEEKSSCAHSTHPPTTFLAAAVEGARAKAARASN